MIGLLKVFQKYFDRQSAKKYQRKPESIANKVYANRYGNGDVLSGDGWRYRGRGLIQITFKDNYEECSDDMGIDFVKNPDLLLTPKYATLSAGWYWDSRGLNEYADNGDMKRITKLINGGYNRIK